MTLSSRSLAEVLADAKALAAEYYAVTSRPLGVTGEVAEYEATRLLRLRLAPAREAGYDAVEDTPDGPRRIQIKGRRRQAGHRGWGRMGSIDLSKEFDSVMLVLLDEFYETLAIWEAPRSSVEEHLLRPGSRARNERGSMATSAFSRLPGAVMRWARED